jgi:ribosome recycling factor
LRVTFPELTSERRAQLSKIAGDKTEQAKVTLRSHRTDALKALDTAAKDGGMGKDEITRLKGEAQKLIDAGNDALAKILDKKETEIIQ